MIDTQTHTKQDRLYKIQMIMDNINYLSSQYEFPEKERFVAEFMFRFGISRRKMLEYLDMLKTLDKIEFYERESDKKTFIRIKKNEEKKD